ncbi:unnamed protein product [Prunus brigantina]
MRCGWCAGVPARPTVRRGFDRVWVGDGWCSGALKNQGSYDILMNGFFLQSTTTPRKACKSIESALQEK